MNYFYKISPAEAKLIGVFFYMKNRMFDPYVGEQEDGSFLVSEESYNELKYTDHFKRVDFSNKVKVLQSDLNTKKIM